MFRQLKTYSSAIMTIFAGNPATLDLVTRLHIVKGMVRGLAYLHTALPSLTIPHGQLKASNVLLNESLEPLLKDYALDPVMNSTQLLVAYMSPEYTQFSQISRKSDVWSLGIIILEILSGKIVSDDVRQEESMNLVSWVDLVIREEHRTCEVLDSKMESNKLCEGEMLKLLQIGLACCERDVEKRLELEEVVGRIEELRERASSEGDVYYSSRGLSSEDISI